MPERDTSMGGTREAFPDTLWSTVLRPRTDEGTASIHRERLCRRYWRPVYAYVRAGWSSRIEDAKDLTQGFFEHLLRSAALERYERGRGRFRHFLKGILKKWLAEQRRRQSAERRGGGRVRVSLDAVSEEPDRGVRGSTLPTPDQVFDRRWRRDLVAAAVNELRRVLHAEGRRTRYAVYEAYEIGAPDAATQPTYEEVARRLGLSTHDVKNHLYAARCRLHELLRRRVRATVARPEEVDAEIQELLTE